MEDREPSPPHHDPHDGVPRGGRWVRWIGISIALVIGVAIAPQSLKLPIGAVSIITLLIGVKMLMTGKPEESK